MNKTSLIIIGGGAAGLMAAYQLSSLYDITLLEAKPRLGGRMWTTTLPGDTELIEAGAEFVHGQLPLTLGLLKSAGIPYHKVEGKMYRKQNGQLEEQSEMTEGWDKLLEKMQQLKTDMSLAQFLETYFGSEAHRELRQQAIGYAGGFDLAEPHNASTKTLYQEWSQEGEDNYRISGGYAALIAYLQSDCEKRGCRILTGKTIRQVDWDVNDIKVYTGEGEVYFAQQLIITVPVAVLHKNAGAASINFTPPLREQEEALLKLGPGKVIKAILKFKHSFWEKDAGFFFSEEAFPTWWSQLPSKSRVLTGWAGGPRAGMLEHLDDDELLNIALQSLSGIFNIPVDELADQLESFLMVNWQKDEQALCGYSYSTVQSREARQLLKRPVKDTIWFCGEALYDGQSPGTVEAALHTAKDVAERMIRN